MMAVWSLDHRCLGTGFHKEPRKKGKAASEPAEDSGREARWARIGLAATKQSLRCVCV